MNYNDIHWHDSVILRVIEIPSEARLLFEVDYPMDWENQKWEAHTIGFEDLFTYQIHEGPFAGSPTILEATKLSMDAYGNTTLRLDTTAGYRIIKFKVISITRGKFTS